MVKKKIVMVLLSELSEDFYVRQQLDEEHALFLAGLIEDGVNLPPITITADYQVIDGRHRITAHDLLGLDKIKAEMIETADKVELIATAYRCNTGGALPPTKEDTEHTIRLLLENRVSKTKIRELLELPSSLGRKWVDNVQSKMNRQKTMAAMDAITDGGLNARQAADKYGVPLEKLKEALSGRKKKSKTDGISGMKRDLTQRYRSVGVQNGGTLGRLLKLVEDGDVSPKQAKVIIAHLERLQAQSAGKVGEWRKRFEALYNEKK
jgi:hypothetical protein